MAMDVVDTLRHREKIFLREIDSAGREEDLVQRLKEIYAAQGMTVPEETIRSGVQAMADNRFAYTPTRPGVLRRLAIIYITRARWWKPVAAVLGACILVAGTYQVSVAMPRAAAERAQQVLLNETLPAELEAARSAVLAVSAAQAGIAQADTLHRRGEDALAARDAEAARAAIDALGQLEREIASSYNVRVVNDPDELSGFWREHDDIPGGRNYYLVVEAIDPTGLAVPVTVMDEETGETARVARWGQRVSRTVFEGVAADKRDDAIIQDSIIGSKAPGLLAPTYSVSTPGGAVTQW